MFGAPQLRKKSNFGLNIISFLKDQQSSSNRPKTEPVGWSRCPIWTLHHFTGQMRTRVRCRQCLGEDPLLSQWRWPNVVPKVFRENWILVLLSSSFNSVCIDGLHFWSIWHHLMTWFGVVMFLKDYRLRLRSHSHTPYNFERGGTKQKTLY